MSTGDDCSVLICSVKTPFEQNQFIEGRIDNSPDGREGEGKIVISVYIDSLPHLHIDVAPVPLRIDTLAPSSLECQNDE